MAETTSTRPNRQRRSSTKTAADTPTKATPAKATKAAAAKAAPVATDADRQKIPVILEYVGDTKSYAVFVPPKSSGCVGKFYAPLGTEEVKVLLIGPASE